jgi:hypothetical protein
LLCLTCLGKTIESRLHNAGVDQSFPVFIQSGFILESFFLHSYFTSFLPAFLHLSIQILLLNSHLYNLVYQDFFKLDCGGYMFNIYNNSTESIFINSPPKEIPILINQKPCKYVCFIQSVSYIFQIFAFLFAGELTVIVCAINGTRTTHTHTHTHTQTHTHTHTHTDTHTHTHTHRHTHTDTHTHTHRHTHTHTHTHTSTLR